MSVRIYHTRFFFLYFKIKKRFDLYLFRDTHTYTHTWGCDCNITFCKVTESLCNELHSSLSGCVKS